MDIQAEQLQMYPWFLLKHHNQDKSTFNILL